MTGGDAGRDGAGNRTASRAGGRVPPTSDFEYELPESLVARYPAERRDGSRLLVLRRAGCGGTGGPDDGPGDSRAGGLEGERSEAGLRDHRFSDLPDLLDPGDALVLNDTRVFPARLRGRKPTGARAEVLLLRPVSEDPGERRWRALVRPGGKLKPGREVLVGDGLTVAIEASLPDGGRIVRLEGEGTPGELVDRFGEVPLPPYVDRDPEPEDRRRYQTVYAEHTGSVAAPTAGLHFTSALLDQIRAGGVEVVRITLHVGVGTFRPVDADRPEDHELHAERYRVTPGAARRLNRVRAAGGRVWAVGTTTVRTLETVTRPPGGSTSTAGGAVGAPPEPPGSGGPTGPYRAAEGWTDLFIHPPFEFRGVDALITNFHLPRSSLLMLVAAFAGTDTVLQAYRHAVRRGYRFYSYGDAMAIL